MDWTEARCEEARVEIEKKGTLAGAAVSLSSKWKMKITREMLKSGLYRARRRGATGLKPGVALDEDLEEDAELEDVPSSNGFAPWQNYSPSPGYVEPKPNKLGKVLTPQIERGIVIPDTHVPLQDKRAFSLMLGILKEWKPHYGVIIGDFMDLGALSRHPSNKPDHVKLSEEYHATNVALDQMQEVSPNTDWSYIEGNHEYRAVRYMNEQGNLSGMLNVPQNLFILPRSETYHRDGTSNLRGMKWIDYDHQPLLTPHSAYYHGIHYTNKHHAASTAEQYCPVKCKGLPCFFGHMHSLQSFTAANGCFAQCCGFLGNEQSLGYLQGKPTSWVHGLVIQEVVGTSMSYSTIRLDSDRVVFGGKIVSI